MIKTFKHKGLELYFTRNNSRLLNSQQVAKIRRLHDRLDAAEHIDDMDIPGFYLHPLKGKKQGFWSVRVSGKWRITFRFEKTHAYDVNLEDYH